MASEVSDDAPSAMRAVKIFAMYESSDDADAKARCVEAIEAMLEDEGSAEDATTRLMAATMRAREGNYAEAT